MSRSYFNSEKLIVLSQASNVVKKNKKSVPKAHKGKRKRQKKKTKKKDKETKQFVDMIGDLKKLGNQADKLLDMLVKAEQNWFTGSLLKIFK